MQSAISHFKTEMLAASDDTDITFSRNKHSLLLAVGDGLRTGPNKANLAR